MRKTDLQRFRNMLLEEKERVSASLARHEKIIAHTDDQSGLETGKAHSNHMADQGSDEFQYETTIKFAKKEGRHLYNIEEALTRIEDGTYGKCQGCGGNIALPRLKSLPFARLCIECKEKEEAGQF
ncbi:molecular chaperone DnaK [bacterium DOLJORAL78_65_58]|nr:MAG: molecular chaperone DnaK [bacterium DOLZORAL124_64_63]PIE76699.1 MAG: molecular chaperone DnaK [bacterium DOLJORAL78_65_58]